MKTEQKKDNDFIIHIDKGLHFEFVREAFLDFHWIFERRQDIGSPCLRSSRENQVPSWLKEIAGENAYNQTIPII